MTKRRGEEKVYLMTAHPYHFEEAQEVACAAGFELQLLFPKDLPVPADAAGLLVPLDQLCLDAHGRRRLLEQLPLLAPDVPTAAYGYDFDNEKPGTHNGVAVARKLNADLLDALLGRIRDTKKAA